MTAKPERCETCQHRPSPLWQCSHAQCPNRRPVTADAPEHLKEGRVPAHLNDNH